MKWCIPCDQENIAEKYNEDCDTFSLEGYLKKEINKGSTIVKERDQGDIDGKVALVQINFAKKELWWADFDDSDEDEDTYANRYSIATMKEDAMVNNAEVKGLDYKNSNNVDCKTESKSEHNSQWTVVTNVQNSGNATNSDKNWLILSTPTERNNHLFKTTKSNNDNES